MANVKKGAKSLTGEQHQTAVRVAVDAIWHDQQIQQLAEAFAKAKGAGDLSATIAIGAAIEAHKWEADKNRGILTALGFDCRLF